MWNCLLEIAANFFYKNRHYNLSFNKSSHRSAILWLLNVLTLYKCSVVSSVSELLVPRKQKKLFIRVINNYSSSRNGLLTQRL